MSEAWREVARLGKKGEKYPPHPGRFPRLVFEARTRGREDEKYYSSLLNLLQGLYEHLLRRKDRETARAVLEMKAILGQNLKDARELGEEQEREFPNPRQRLLEAADKNRSLEGSRPIQQGPEIAAGASDLESEAA